MPKPRPAAKKPSTVRKAPAHDSSARAPSLDARDWLRAAARALAEGGIEAVRVEPLAAALGVTKGSFYWHFRDRDALLTGLLYYWEQRATLDVITTLDTTNGAAAKLERLLGLVAAYEDTAAEAAIRAWAVHDNRALAGVLRVDERREVYVANLLRELGAKPAEARDRARLAVLAVAGSMLAGPKGRTHDSRSLWNTLRRMLLSRD